MNNREVIDQVERGYRMAQPSHVSYPESKSMSKEVAGAQSNVYKVSRTLSRILEPLNLKSKLEKHPTYFKAAFNGHFLNHRIIRIDIVRWFKLEAL